MTVFVVGLSRRTAGREPGTQASNVCTHWAMSMKDDAKTRTVADFAELLRYNRWATDRVLRVLEADDDPPDRAVELLAHVLRAQDIWYGRVQKTDHADLALWAEDDLGTCAERAEASHSRWQRLLQDLGPEGLNDPVVYTNSSGTAFETPLRDILSHVINHGTHHRAQIALVLREAGIEPPPTDYIFYVRER